MLTQYYWKLKLLRRSQWDATGRSLSITDVCPPPHPLPELGSDSVSLMCAEEELWRAALEQAESSNELYNKLNNFWF